MEAAGQTKLSHRMSLVVFAAFLQLQRAVSPLSSSSALTLLFRPDPTISPTWIEHLSAVTSFMHHVCRRLLKLVSGGAVWTFFLLTYNIEGTAATKPDAGEEWRRLTSALTNAPRLFLHKDRILLFFEGHTNTVAFSAELERSRVPSHEIYEVYAAPLRLENKTPGIPVNSQRWREATVISGADWRKLATNLIAALTPPHPWQGAYYRGFLGDRFLYRDSEGSPRFGTITNRPPGVTIDQRYSIEETLQILAKVYGEALSRSHPDDSLFLLLAPLSGGFPQPLVLDRDRHDCILLSPAALYHSTEPGFALNKSPAGVGVLVFESHVVAIIKNPVSSVARLGNLLYQTFLGLVRLPMRGPPVENVPLTHAPCMDLTEWEGWLDHHTHTRQEKGSIHLLIDGERFFPRFEQAAGKATNHVHMDVYIFDTDDFAVEVAKLLKDRSDQVNVNIVIDRLGSIAAAAAPPATLPPKGFVSPSSITSYLERDSKVHVRPFLNPFFSYDHSKVYLVDGMYAWLGGMNVGREYRSEWHDMMVELAGPVVLSLENDFRLDWAHASALGDLAYLAAVLERPKHIPESPTTGALSDLRLLPTKTLWKPFNTAVLGALQNARSYIFVEHPYLFDKLVIKRLVEARNRGVDVRVIFPRVNDSRSGARVELVTANYFLEHGIRVFFYPGMTHVKALLVDGWAAVGSANLNQFGLRLDQEHNVGTSDPEFCEELKNRLFEEDFTHSQEMVRPLMLEWTDFLTQVVLEGL